MLAHHTNQFMTKVHMTFCGGVLLRFLLSLPERSVRVMHCLFVSPDASKNIALIDLILLHKKCYTVARSSSKMIRIGIWTQEFISGFFTCGR